MKRFLVLFFFLILFVPNAHAKDLSETDGVDWGGWDSSRKLFYLNGFISAADNIAEELSDFEEVEGYSDEEAFKLYTEYLAGLKNPEQARPFETKEIRSILELQKRLRMSALFRYSVLKITVGQLATGLDQFYGDFKNKNIRLTDAVYLVKKQITGASPDEIERISEWLRGGKKDIERLVIRNKNGNIEKIILFP